MPAPGRLLERIKRGLDVTQNEALRLWYRVNPVIVVQDLTPPWTHGPGDVKLCHGGSRMTTLVTQPNIQLLNPSGSGVLVRIKQFILGSDSNTFCQIRHQDTVLTTLSAVAFYADRRVSGKPAAQIRQQDVAGGGDSVVRVPLTIAPLLLYDEMILEPGQGCTVNIPYNKDLVASFVWDEIPL